MTMTKFSMVQTRFEISLNSTLPPTTCKYNYSFELQNKYFFVYKYLAIGAYPSLITRCFETAITIDWQVSVSTGGCGLPEEAGLVVLDVLVLLDSPLVEADEWWPEHWAWIPQLGLLALGKSAAHFSRL